MADELEFDILPDGRAKVTTGVISQPNHVNSENVLRFIANLTGGPSKRTARTDVKKGDRKHHQHSKS